MPRTPEAAYDQMRDAGVDGDVDLQLQSFTDAAIEQLAIVCAAYGIHDWTRLRAQAVLNGIHEGSEDGPVAPGGASRPGALVSVLRRHGFEDADFERLSGEVGTPPGNPFVHGSALRERCALVRDRRALVRDLLPLFHWDPVRYAHVTDVEIDGDTAIGHLSGDLESVEVRFVREEERWKVDAFVVP